MSDKAAAIDALVYDWHRSERSDDCCVQPLSRLRSSFRSGSADNVSTGADICNASNRAGEPETWSNSTIFASGRSGDRGAYDVDSPWLCGFSDVCPLDVTRSLRAQQTPGRHPLGAAGLGRGSPRRPGRHGCRCRQHHNQAARCCHAVSGACRRASAPARRFVESSRAGTLATAG